jgi:hypothetical protein
MLEEAPQKLMSRQPHRLAAMVAAVTVGEGDRVIIASDDRLVGNGGAMNVPPQVLEHTVRAMDDRFGKHYPTLVPWDVGKLDGGQRTSSEVKESSTEVLGQCAYGHEETFAARGRGKPCAPISGKGASGHEHVDVGVPFEGTCPCMEHGERADLAACPTGVFAQSREGIERGTRQYGQERALMRAHHPS